VQVAVCLPPRILAVGSGCLEKDVGNLVWLSFVNKSGSSTSGMGAFSTATGSWRALFFKDSGVLAGIRANCVLCIQRVEIFWCIQRVEIFWSVVRMGSGFVGNEHVLNWRLFGSEAEVGASIIKAVSP
jgi:hypothetical protein